MWIITGGVKRTQVEVMHIITNTFPVIPKIEECAVILYKKSLRRRHRTIPVSKLKTQPIFLENVIHLQKPYEILDNKDQILLKDNPLWRVDQKYRLEVNEVIKNKLQSYPETLALETIQSTPCLLYTSRCV